MSWKFWKTKNDTKNINVEDETQDESDLHVNTVFARLIQKEFSEHFFKAFDLLMSEDSLEKAKGIWEKACQLSSVEFDTLQAEELEIYYPQDAKFPSIVIVLPETDDCFVPIYVSIVFHLGAKTSEMVASGKSAFKFFVFEEENEGGVLYEWKDDNRIEYDDFHEISIESFVDAIEDETSSLKANNTNHNRDISFIEKDDEGNEIESVFNFEKEKQKIDDIETKLNRLASGKTDTRLVFKLLAYEILLEQFNDNPLMNLQIFTNPKYRDDMFRQLFELACSELGEEFDKTIVQQFNFKLFTDVINCPVLVIIFPDPIEITEIYYVAFVYNEGIINGEVVDENMVKFRYFSLEKSINGCCFLETNDNERVNYGDEFEASLDEFLILIQQVVNDE